MTDFRKNIFTPTWHLENVRSLAKENPYTFFVPSEQLLDSLEVGDSVKLMFSNDIQQESDQWEAERMWVSITQINGENFVGVLDNNPYEMKQLKVGDIIHFKKYHIMAYHGEKQDPVAITEYWDRCWTTNAILNGNAPIGYICRTEPMAKKHNEKYVDTGWQILSGNESDEYMDDPATIQYVALGKLLNIDDSFIHLLDSKVGSAFYKNDNGEWVADEEFKSMDE